MRALSAKKNVTKTAATLLAAAVLSVAACSRGPSNRPVADLASSVDAQVAFAPLREAWADPRLLSRNELRAGLDAFLAKYPKDGLVPLARVYLVFLWLDEGDDARAELTLSPLAKLPEGATRDLATVARARILRRRGDSDAAFELLRPLVGKLVDGQARAVFGEELTLAAAASHRDYEAVAYMDAWLRATSEDERDAVRGKVKKALEGMDPSVLIGALRTMRTQEARGGYSAEMQRLVTERLAAVAVAKNDSDLARWLTTPDATGYSVVVEGAAGESLGELATTRRGVRRVAGRTIGLLLPIRDVRSQDEAAEIIRGMAWALDLPRRDRSGSNDLRLVTRDASTEGDPIETRLDELASEGVSVIVTGLRPQGAARALAWADARHIAVVTLSSPPTRLPGPFGFVLGESLDTQLAALSNALVARKITRVAPVVEDLKPDAPVPFTMPQLPFASTGVCEGDTVNAAASPFPTEAWQRESVKAWVVSAPVDCARKLVRFGTTSLRGGTLALTLEASPAVVRVESGAFPDGLKILAASAGVIPRMPSAGANANDDVAELTASVGREPDWWTALGRDAGVLARIALATLPTDETTVEAEVMRRREVARAGLETAATRLWTTEKTGMSPGSHVLARTINVVEGGSGTRASR